MSAASVDSPQQIAAQLAAGETPDLTGLDAVLRIDSGSAIAHVQGGVTWGQLELALARRAFTIGPLPDGLREEAIATTWADDAGRRPSARYGQLSDAIIAVRAALPDGRVTHASVSPRRAVGPDLPRCSLGAGFANGVLCEAHVQAWPRARRVVWRAARFDGWRAAVDGVVATLRAGVPSAWLEIARADGRVQVSARLDIVEIEEALRFDRALGGLAVDGAEARYTAALEAGRQPLRCVFAGPAAAAAEKAEATRGARILGVAPHDVRVFARAGKPPEASAWIELAEHLTAALREGR